MTQHTYKSARRRYVRVFWPLMAIYTVIVLAGSFYLASLETQPVWLQVALAVASAVPVVAVLFVMLRYFAETDEYSRLLQYKAFAYGAVFTVSAIMLVGFLQLFDVIGSVQVFWFGPAFFLAYGLTYRFLGGKECL
ncbi:MAG: hypothetical protein AAGI14_07940 [Pseudomonadota bacterium]